VSKPMNEPTLDRCTRLIQAGPQWICTCGQSKNGLFCDGSHKGTDFAPLKLDLTETTEVTYLTGVRA
jgi:CDGSH-type Zn-finger protein